MFKRLDPLPAETVTIYIEDQPVRVPAGETVAAAVLVHGLGTTRTTPVSGAPRAPLCMMGVCFDCLMEIDGVRDRQACLLEVAEGMRVRRQHFPCSDQADAAGQDLDPLESKGERQEGVAA